MELQTIKERIRLIAEFYATEPHVTVNDSILDFYCQEGCVYTIELETEKCSLQMSGADTEEIENFETLLSIFEDDCFDFVIT